MEGSWCVGVPLSAPAGQYEAAGVQRGRLLRQDDRRHDQGDLGQGTPTGALGGPGSVILQATFFAPIYLFLPLLCSLLRQPTYLFVSLCLVVSSRNLSRNHLF